MDVLMFLAFIATLYNPAALIMSMTCKKSVVELFCSELGRQMNLISATSISPYMLSLDLIFQAHYSTPRIIDCQNQ